ncbi:unnamed protein product [Urochloa humidicola]
MVEAAGRSREAAGMKKKAMMSKTKQPERKDGQGHGGWRTTRKQSREAAAAAESPSYRLALRSLFSCRNSSHGQQEGGKTTKQGLRLGCSAPSICKHRDDEQGESSSQQDETACNFKRRPSVSGSERRVNKKPLTTLSELQVVSKQQMQLPRGGSWSSSSSSFRAGMQLRRLSGCYECHMVVDPVLGGGSSMRACPCPDCGEIFVRQDSLQLHQSISHAVCELGGDDTSRNIIEIIFQSSWLKKQSPVCKIQRILKVQNTPRTLARFEEYREAVKAKAAAAATQAKTATATATSSNKHPRCTADGNELLRFHCARLGCELGLNGATHLCSSSASSCAACAIIRHGFAAGGVRTMATSGRAHDALLLVQEQEQEEERGSRAMLVCRVIAGRVKRPPSLLGQAESSAALPLEASSPEEAEDGEEFDSVAASAGVYSNLEELLVFNPRAILPCFVVVYKA